MKKTFTKLTWLLLSTLLLLPGACSDSDDVTAPQGLLVSNVFIPTSMDVYLGMELPLSGRGFEQGDGIVLRADEDIEAEVSSVAAKQLVFTFPDGVVNQGTYRFILTRGNKYQILGSSKLSVHLVVNVDLGSSIALMRGQSATIKGNGFSINDILTLKQGGGNVDAVITGATSGTLTFTIPEQINIGSCEMTLKRGSQEQDLGSVIFSPLVPDKTGATIKGVVLCDGAGVPDVVISDGDLLTTTDSDGYYWLNSTKRNELAFIVLPSGYDVPTKDAMPLFWHPTAAAAGAVEQIDFELETTDNDKHTMLVATDMHLANRNKPLDYLQFADGFVKEVKDGYNNSSDKVYCLNLGDFSWDLYWYDNRWGLPECKNAVKEFDFQMWSVMGNHDNDPYVAGDYIAEAPYRKNMGPVYYSMNIGKVHYIMLDNTVYINTNGTQGTAGSRNYDKYFTPEQIEWLKKDLAYVNKSTPIVVGFHCPLYTYTSTGTIGIQQKNQTEINKLLDCFDGFSSVTTLSGHTHVNRCVQSPTHANVYEHNVAAVCGSWWWTYQYAKNNICTDGTPAGYKIFDIDGTNLKWKYKAVGLPQTQQFTTFDMNKVKEYWTSNATALSAFTSGHKDIAGRGSEYASVGSNVVYINVWAHEPGWTVSVKEGSTDLTVKQIWNKYDPLHTLSYDIPRGVTNDLTFPSTICQHMFEVTASSAISTLEITATDKFGNTSSQTMTRPKELVTDPSK